MPATVLIIDDAIHIRRLAVRMLERVGFDTLEADEDQSIFTTHIVKTELVERDSTKKGFNHHP